MIDEGMAVVTAVRDRYRGFNRNPFNEIECGNNYARSMASFALLPVFSGFSFDLPNGTLGFSPVLPGDFRAPWFAGGAWGEFERTEDKTVLTAFSGTLRVTRLKLPYLQSVKRVLCDEKRDLIHLPGRGTDVRGRRFRSHYCYRGIRADHKINAECGHKNRALRFYTKLTLNCI